VPGSVFKIVTAIGGMGSGAITPFDDLRGPARGIRHGFLVEGFPHPRLPATVQTRPSSRLLRGDRGLEQHLVRARRTHRAGPNACDVASTLRLRPAHPVRPADLTEPGQRAAGPFGGFRDQVELANAAYGQAEVLVTPLQMALVAATVANDGLLMKPKLVDELRASDGTVTHARSAAWSQVIDRSTRR
jgi:peptidoglycan glycosyltransferase